MNESTAERITNDRLRKGTHSFSDFQHFTIMKKYQLQFWIKLGRHVQWNITEITHKIMMGSYLLSQLLTNQLRNQILHYIVISTSVPFCMLSCMHRQMCCYWRMIFSPHTLGDQQALKINGKGSLNSFENSEREGERKAICTLHFPITNAWGMTPSTFRRVSQCFTVAFWIIGLENRLLQLTN